MSIIGFIKRIRTALYKKAAIHKKHGNFVFIYKHNNSLKKVNYQNINNNFSKHFDGWTKKQDIINLIEKEVSENNNCYACLDAKGTIESYLLKKNAADISDWFIDLPKNDVVLYSIVTHPKARGRRLAGRLAASVAKDCNNEGSNVYLDCASWNISAHRAFETAGFIKLQNEVFPEL